LSALLSALFIASITARGVLPGAKTAHQAGALKPGKPLSEMVGTLGKAEERFAVRNDQRNDAATFNMGLNQKL
jgi:hypothetical protein